MEFEASQQHWFPAHDTDGNHEQHQAETSPRQQRHQRQDGAGGGGNELDSVVSGDETRRISGADDRECWICKDGDSESAPLFDGYCHCRGTLGFAHESCMARWVFVQRKTECPSCSAVYECIDESNNGDSSSSHRNDGDVSYLGKVMFLTLRLVLPLIIKICSIVAAVVLQFIVMPWIYGLAFYSNRLIGLSDTSSQQDHNYEHVSNFVDSHVTTIGASATTVVSPPSLLRLLASQTIEMNETASSSVMVVECVARSSFLGLPATSGLWLCNTTHIFLYGIVVASFFRMIRRGWSEWSRFIVDAPLLARNGVGAEDDPQVVAYSQVQYAMQCVDRVMGYVAWAPRDTKGKREFFMSSTVEMIILLSFTWIARSGQRLLASFLVAVGLAIYLRLVHPPPKVTNKALRFHEATAAKLQASAMQVRLWFTTYILDIVAFSIILPIVGGYVVHYGGSGFIVEPDGLARVVIAWMGSFADGTAKVMSGDATLSEGAASCFSGLIELGGAFLAESLLVMSGEPPSIAALVPGLLELAMHWLMGTICVITLVRYESLIILPLFAPGVDFFFIRAIDLTYQDEEETLCWSLVLTQVYDADPFRVLTDLARLVLVECSALAVFVRFPVVATYTLFGYVFPASLSAINLPLPFGTMHYASHEPANNSSSSTMIADGGYGDIMWNATLIHFFIFGCAVTSLATFPAQRIQLYVLRPAVHALGTMMGLRDFLFEKDRLDVLDDWLDNKDADTLVMPYVPPDVMCVRRERRLPSSEQPYFLKVRMIAYSVCFLALSTTLSWTPVVLFATAIMYVSQHSATIICCSLALPFLFWSPRLFFLAVMQFIGVIGFCVVVPVVYVVNFCQSVYYSDLHVNSLYRQTMDMTFQVKKRVKRRGDKSAGSS